MANSGYEAHLDGVNKGIQAEIKEEEERDKWCHNHLDSLNVKMNWFCEFEDKKWCRYCLQDHLIDPTETYIESLFSEFERVGELELIASEHCELEIVRVFVVLPDGTENKMEIPALIL